MNISIISIGLINCFKRLQVKNLNLKHNKINYICNELASVSSIEIIQLQGNRICSIPEEYCENWTKLQKYLLSISTRANNWNERKIICVGASDVGKSTLVECFLTKNIKQYQIQL